jgi:hypothetical protein
VYAHIQVSLIIVGQGHSPFQVFPLFGRSPYGTGIAQVGIRIPGHQHHGACLSQACRQASAHLQGHILLHGATPANNTWIDAAMSGIDYDHPVGQRSSHNLDCFLFSQVMFGSGHKKS